MVLLQIVVFQIVVTILTILVSKKIGLVDIPNERKLHVGQIPFTGGIVLCISYLFIVFVSDFHLYYINLILSYAFLSALSGFIDDKYKVNPGTKILLQSIPIFFLIDNNLYLLDLGDYAQIGILKLGSFDKVFTFVCCIFILNACNYTDGIDGLLPLIAIIIIGNFIFLSYHFNKNELAMYYSLILIPLFVHSIFNLGIIKGFKIFLGDSGSSLIGFIIAFLSIYNYKFESIHPVLIIWSMSYIVYEFLFVNIFRIFNKNNLFKPGLDHFHYELKKKLNLSNFEVLLILFTINIFFILIGYLLFFKFSSDVSLIFFILIFFVYSCSRYYFRLKI